MLSVFRVGPPTRVNVCLRGEKLAQHPALTYLVNRVTLQPASPSSPRQVVICHVNAASLRFIKKRMNSWRAQGDSGRRVTRVPGTTFSHLNRARFSLTRGLSYMSTALFIICFTQLMIDHHSPHHVVSITVSKLMSYLFKRAERVLEGLRHGVSCRTSVSITHHEQ